MVTFTDVNFDRHNFDALFVSNPIYDFKKTNKNFNNRRKKCTFRDFCLEECFLYCTSQTRKDRTGHAGTGWG